MSHRYTKSCDQCGNSFTTDRKETRACSKSCAAYMAKPLPWLECSKCMAVIGLGLRSTAKLLGLRTPQQVASAWTVRGIKRTIPAEGSWDLYARRRGMCHRSKMVPAIHPLPWWGDHESASAWMSNVEAWFPDWSAPWDEIERQRAFRRTFERMNPEVRRKRRRFEGAIYPSQAPDLKAAYARKYIKLRKLRDPGFKIARNLRNRFKEIMEVARDPSRKWNSSLIGCDTHRLAAHLESQFTRGITWENYGTHWHVDHIIPCAAFDHTKPEQVRQCWHFTNLRPLEAKANMAKGAKIEAPQLQLLLTH